MSWNPGWEKFGAWVDSLDLTGPTPGCFRLKPDGRGGAVLEPVHIDDLTIDGDRDRLIDEARD